MSLSQTWSRILCLYHFPCPDGIFAAFAAHLYHKHHNLDVKFIGNKTYDPVTVDSLALNGDECVYLLDFAGPPSFAYNVAKSAGRLVVLDHHKTAQADLESINTTDVPNLELQFDMARSGAMISLDYFNPPGVTDAQLRMFKYIQDGDLWEWKYPESKAFYAGLHTLKYSWDVERNPAIFDQLAALNPDELIATGQAKMEEQDERVQKCVDTAFAVQLGGPQVGIDKQWGTALCALVYGDQISLRSHLGNALAAASAARGHAPIGAVGYVVNDMFKVSLRSIGDDVDTTVISQFYGGGGHKNASSFMLDTSAEFDTWRV